MNEIIGNAPAREQLKRLITSERVPGTLLFAGPSGVGKRLFALELARALNCPAAQGGVGCGMCQVCRRITHFSLPAADDKDAHKRIVWSEHADVGQILPYNRYILVDAARALDHEAHFRPYEGAARVFIIDDADKFNEAAANALLKTLEEPPATTYLVLLTSRPAALLPTIRSRCQVVRFAPLPAAEIESYLARQRHISPNDTGLLARLADGSLGRALSLNVAEYREQRAMMLEVLQALTFKPNRVRLLRVSEELADAKRKEHYEAYFDTLTRLVRDVWAMTHGAGDAQLVNADARAQLQPISQHLPGPRAASWLRAIEEHLQRLNVNINRKAATDALMLAMARG